MTRCICEHCHNPYYASKRANRTKYCSRACKARAYRLRVKGRGVKEELNSSSYIADVVNDLMSNTAHKNLIKAEVTALLTLVPKSSRVKAIHHVRNICTEYGSFQSNEVRSLPF